MKNFKDFAKGLPKIFWFYIAIIFLAEIIVFSLRPDEPGLYTQWIQIIPTVCAIPFLLFRGIRKKFSFSVYAYSFLSLFFLVLDYNSADFNGAGHAGLVQIATTFCPIGVFGFIKFLIWNIHRLKEKDSRIALALSSMAWGLYAFAFPPLPLGPASLLLLVPWFIAMNRFKRNQVLFATFWSGMLYNSINYYWIYNVMHVETAPSGLILLGLILLIAYFSLYNVIAALFYTLANVIKIKGHALLLLLYPLFYAGLEMTRTRGDFSFPWSHLGYAFGNHLELLQALAFIGIFGYTALIIFSNLVVAKAIEKKGKQNRWVFVIPAVIFTALLVHGTIVLSAPEAQPFYGSDSDDAPKIALVQPSIKQGEKWSKARFDSITTKTFSMISDSVEDDAKLIVLAETAIPDHIRRHPELIRRLFRISSQRRASILVGALDYKRNPPGSLRKFDIYNAAFRFSEYDEMFPERYIKKHLVPFSERIPFDDIFPILNYVDLGEGDFVPGKETPVYEPFFWTPGICYDAIFGDIIRASINAGSRLFVNITNDGWFGRSTAPYQHLNLIRYRAIENGMPIARTANSGVSSFIDQYGHFDKNTDIFTDAVVQRKMPLKTRNTLYQHIGDSVETALLWFFAFYVLLVTALWLMKKIGSKKEEAAASARP